MAFSNYLINKGRRSLRTNIRTRFRYNPDNDEDTVHIDIAKDVNLVTYEILKNVSQKQDISEEKYLAYLNAFVKLLIHHGNDYFAKVTYCTEDIFICLRITLLNESSLVRAGGLRVLRYIIKTEQHVAILNKLQYPALIARSLDLILVRNDSERVQALRLARRILIVAPQLFHIGIARSLVCVALGSKTPAEIEDDKQRKDKKPDNEEEEEKINDRMIHAFIAVLTELCVLNTNVFLNCDGTRALVYGLQIVRPGRMTESILGALIYLLNLPSTRRKASLDFQFVAASFTDIHYLDKHLDNKMWAFTSEVRHWFHVTLLSLLRSWVGVLHFCHPHDSLTLKSLVSTLYLNNLNVRKSVIEVLYELLGLPLPEWTDEFSVILEAVDPSRLQNSFKLSEGFVAKEAKTVLPHIAKCRVDISELQLSLVLYSLLEADILNALIFVIVSEDTLLSVSATVLLGEIMHLVHKQLPPECCNFSPSLPNLISFAVRGRPAMSVPSPPLSPSSPCSALFTDTDMSRCSFSRSAAVPNVEMLDSTQVVQDVIDILQNYSNQTSDLTKEFQLILNSNNVEVEVCPRSQQRAISAITALTELHKMFKKRPAPASIFLEQVINNAEKKEPANMSIVVMKGKNVSKHKAPQILAKEIEDAVKDSGVLTVKDPFAWSWESIRSVFKTKSPFFSKLEDTNHKLFVKKIIQFLLPSNGHLSRCDLSSNLFSLVAMDLLNFLLDCEYSEGLKLLEEFLTDFKEHLILIITSESAHDCLLSPKNVTNTLCQHYFLFIGTLSSSKKGLKALETHGLFEILNKVVTQTTHDCYVKLIVSSLDYSTSSLTRSILSNVLSSEQVCFRLYATQFLSILVRTRLDLQPDYMNWVIENLVNQLQDEKKSISLCALAALDEASDAKHYLEAIIALRPSLLYFGDKGLLLLIRFLSTDSGFTYLNEASFVATQLEKWATHFNYRYVQLMEGEIHDSLTLHKRTEDGQYTRRLSSVQVTIGNAFVLPHLYGQLAQHQKGFDTLVKHEKLYNMFETILKSRYNTDEEILELKASLWAVGNIATSPAGVKLIAEHGVVTTIVRLAEQCTVYSIRATAFYCLSLISTTRQGASFLHSMGWLAVCNNRHDMWPIVRGPSPLPSPIEDSFSRSCTIQNGCNESSTGQTPEDEDHVPPIFFMGADNDSNKSSDPPWSRKERERRSATLPHKSLVSPLPQHVRSFSESKAESADSWENVADMHAHVTADDISDIRMSEACKKSRSDSCCTDSSTSGVSSCDSTHGRYHIIGEKVHQTLSPIPSTGSIATIKSVPPIKSITTSPSVSKRHGEKHRDFPSLSLRAKLLSHHHSLSHATFISLRSLRPHPSPSISTLANIDLINLQEDNKMSPLNRPKLSAKYMHQPLLHEFEVTEAPCVLGEPESTPALSARYPSSVSCILSPSGQPTFGEEAEELWSGPCYQGICLPLHLAQMFPPLDAIYSRSSSRLHNVIESMSNEAECGVCSETEMDLSKKKYKHDRNDCLLCVVKYAPNRSQILRNRKISASSIHRTRSETESSYGGGPSNDGESPILVPWHQPTLETTLASVDSSASSENGCGFAKALLDSNCPSRSTVRKELLKLVESLANPVLFRTCKQGLLTIKQSCKDLFQDPCVYSDVSHIMASCNHKLLARRFIQDLFIDSTFSELQEESKSILSSSPTIDPIENMLNMAQHERRDNPSSSSHHVSTNNSSNASEAANNKPCKPDVADTTSPCVELAVIMENDTAPNNCEEQWCPESQSDYVLENMNKYCYDSIDDVTEETLFMKPCSSRIDIDHSESYEQTHMVFQDSNEMSEQTFDPNQASCSKWTTTSQHSISRNQHQNSPTDCAYFNSSHPNHESLCEVLHSKLNNLAYPTSSSASSCKNSPPSVPCINMSSVSNSSSNIDCISSLGCELNSNIANVYDSKTGTIDSNSSKKANEHISKNKNNTEKEANLKEINSDPNNQNEVKLNSLDKSCNQSSSSIPIEIKTSNISVDYTENVSLSEISEQIISSKASDIDPSHSSIENSSQIESSNKSNTNASDIRYQSILNSSNPNHTEIVPKIIETKHDSQNVNLENQDNIPLNNKNLTKHNNKEPSSHRSKQNNKTKTNLDKVEINKRNNNTCNSSKNRKDDSKNIKHLGGRINVEV